MSRSIRRFASSLLILALGLVGCNQKSLTVKDAWARPAAAGENGAAYFIINNPSSEADTLLSAQTDVAGMAELHKSTMSDGVMSMEAQENVPISAKSTVEFAPGGLHVMLMGLKNDLKVGDLFSLTLNFEKAGAVVVSVEVKEP